MAKKKLEGIVWPNLPDDTYYLDAEKVEYSEDETYPSGSVGKALSEKAKTDGYYSNLTAGSAEQLLSTVTIEDEVPYQFRTSGGSVDIGDRETDMLVGGTVAWNQLTASDRQTQTISGVAFTNNGDGTISVSGTATANAAFYSDASPSINMIPNHIYYFCGCPSGGTASTYRLGLTQGGSSIVLDYGGGKIAKASTNDTGALSTAVFVANGATVNNLKFTPQAFDLTQMFGSTIADYIYSLEQANAGAGVAFFRKLFPKAYYAYNAGELLSVSGVSSHDMTGFNAWDEEWELGDISNVNGTNITSSVLIRSKNYIPLIENATYYCKAPSDLGNLKARFYDADKNHIGNAPRDSSLMYVNATFVPPANARYLRIVTQSIYGTIYKNDICINLSWDGERNGEYEPYIKHSYPLDDSLTLRGIPKLDSSNNLYYDGDTYESDGTVTRKYGVVDLGTLTWDYDASVPRFYVVEFSGVKPVANNSQVASIICPKYYTTYYNTIANVDKGIAVASTGSITVHDSAYTDKETFKSAMDGVYLVYELATPTTESADPYTNPQIVDDFGTEEYVTTSIVPVGHKTQYMPNLRAKLEMAPNSPNGNGDYIVRQTNGMNEYVPLVIEDTLPTIPSTAGSYKLTVTVTEGSDPVLSWEAE